MDSDNNIVPAAITENVQARLNTLNHASSLINKNGANLDKAQKDYQALLAETSRTLSAYKKKLRSSIEKARPYHDLQTKKKKLLGKLQENSEAYVRARIEHDAAMSVLNSYNIDISKFGDGDESKLEVINDAIQRANSAKTELADLKVKHAEILNQCAVLDENIARYRKSASLAIRKSQTYFDLKATFNQRMEDAKAKINRLTAEVKSAKELYSQTMNSLEAISNRIHESRRLGHWLNSPPISPRICGVGADGSCSSEMTPASTSAPSDGLHGVEINSPLPSSPRHTPPGQDDTDTEAEGDMTDESPFFGSSYASTLRKSGAKHLIFELVSNLEPFSFNTQMKGEQEDLLSLEVRSQHSRSQSL